MAMQLHMTIEGKVQGKIDGPSKITGRDKSFEVLAFSHEVTSPFELRNGSITGKRQHHPLSTLKTVDEASPKLYKALVTSEHLTIEIKWYRPDPEGGAKEQYYFTTKLENAKLVSIAPHMGNVTESGGTSSGHMEQLSFVYDTITWSFEGGAKYIDKWADPA